MFPSNRMKDINEIVSALLDGTLQESETIEVKLTLPHDLPNIAKTIVGIANSGGGYLILGAIEQPRDGGMIVGLDNAAAIQRRLTQILSEYTIGVQGTPYLYTIDSKRVVVFRIEKAESVAYYSRRQTSPVRLIAYTRSAIGSRIKEVAEEKKYYAIVYKYMTLEAFMISLYAKTWRFFEPNKWNDKYEQRFYCAKYTIDGAEHATPQLFATCVTREKNSEAAWKVYSHGQGLGAHCVQLELNIDKLRTELISNGLRIAEMPVEYKDEKYILNLHNQEKSDDYTEYFTSFSFEKFLKLLTLKRDAYSYEREVRLFAIPKIKAPRSTGSTSLYKDLAIDWSKVIRKVRIDKDCTDAELISVQQACFSAGINPVIHDYTFIGNIPKPSDSVDIDFERFDIDAMPGSSRITIK